MATKRQTAAERMEADRKAMVRAITRLKLSDPKDALLCLPASYTDCRAPVRTIPSQPDEHKCLYLLRLTGSFKGFDKNKALVCDFGDEGWNFPLVAACKGGRVQIGLQDESGRLATWTQFGAAWQAKEQFESAQPGDPVVVVARAGTFAGKPTLEDVEHVPARAIGKVWTRYLGIAGGVSGETVEQLVLAQLDNPDAFRSCAAKLTGATGMTAEDALATARKYDEEPLFASFEELLRQLHTPDTPDLGLAARIQAQRLSGMAIHAAALRRHVRAAHPQAPIPIDLNGLDGISRTQPEVLTIEQRQAVEAIAACFMQPKPLMGLLSGDVGTGKTLAYLIPAVAAYRAGARVAIIAPSDLLANQIALQAIERFGPHGVRVERVETGAKRLQDSAAILVSTIGLVSTAKRCNYSPQVLICDEQHKMSTDVRNGMVAPFTHVLEVSGTPIPRTLAAAMYGGMQVFSLGAPAVAKNVQSYVYDVKERVKGVQLLRWAVETGQKAAVVYPRVDNAEDELASVTSGAAALEAAFPGKVGVLHGQMTAAERKVAMDRIIAGETPIIVASTVIETGMDLKKMAGMIVRRADCFGAAQLHQLRGRLARNGGEGFFLMMVDDLETVPPDSLERLHAVAENNDGYALAEFDLVQRGFGDMEGTQQSGDADTIFRLVKLRPEDFLRSKSPSLADSVRRTMEAIERANPAKPVQDEDRRQEQLRLIA